MRYLRGVQQQAKNNSWPRQRKHHINHDREGGHSCLLNDYFSKKFVYIEMQFQ